MVNNLNDSLKCLILLLLLIGLSSCDSNKQQDLNNQQTINSKDTVNNTQNRPNTDTSSKNPRIPKNNIEIKTDNLKFGPAPDVFRVNMNDLFDAYMSITYSLCFSDSKGVKTGTAIFKQMQSRIDPSILTGEMKNYWNGYENELTEIITEMESSNDLEAQRSAFKNLSQLMTVAIKNYKVKDKNIKRYDCPQALNGKGAFWYFEDSSAYTLMNPYFGQESKDCLEPAETINSK